MNIYDQETNGRIFTAIEVSQILGIPLNTIYRLSKQGKIKGVKIGKHWRYEKSDIEKHISFGCKFSKEPARTSGDSVERSDRRSYPRINSNFKCNYSIKLPPFKEIKSEGIIKDISAGGIFLVNQDCRISEIKINDPIKLRFVLIFDDNERIDINVKGKVVRKIRYGVGVKFKDINKKMQNSISEYAG